MRTMTRIATEAEPLRRISARITLAEATSLTTYGVPDFVEVVATDITITLPVPDTAELNAYISGQITGLLGVAGAGRAAWIAETKEVLRKTLLDLAATEDARKDDEGEWVDDDLSSPAPVEA